MSAHDLELWRVRHELSLTTGSEALGISRRTFQNYLYAVSPIPQVVAMAAWGIDCAAYVSKHGLELPRKPPKRRRRKKLKRWKAVDP